MTQESRENTDNADISAPQAAREEGSPALTIIFQTWMTPLIGVLMLAVGLLGGYFGRPLVAPETKEMAVSDPEITPEPVEDISMSPDEDREAQKAAVMESLLGETRHFRGDEDAPVTIIEFSDFQCPYCERWTNEAGAQIEDQYIEQGLVRIGYWHFAILGDQSVLAAEASECAAEQGAFWSYHDYLYQPQIGSQGTALTKDNLKQFAADLGLDTASFNECLDTGQFTQYVQGQRGVAQQIGVSSTPTFLVNGEPVVGAQPFQNFEAVIEQELAASSE